MVKISINLTHDSITSAIKELEQYKKKITNATDEGLKEVAERGRDKAESLYDSLTFTKTGPKPEFTVEKTEKGYKILAKGSSVAFDEYGTGQSAEKPHIGTTKPFINSGYHHWFMPQDIANEYHGGVRFTRGHGAGHFMYDTSVWLRNEYKDILKKKLGGK